jgi:hypothetical protein
MPHSVPGHFNAEIFSKSGASRASALAMPVDYILAARVGNGRIVKIVYRIEEMPGLLLMFA